MHNRPKFSTLFLTSLSLQEQVCTNNAFWLVRPTSERQGKLLSVAVEEMYLIFWQDPESETRCGWQVASLSPGRWGMSQNFTFLIASILLLHQAFWKICSLLEGFWSNLCCTRDPGIGQPCSTQGASLFHLNRRTHQRSKPWEIQKQQSLASWWRSNFEPSHYELGCFGHFGHYQMIVPYSYFKCTYLFIICEGGGIIMGTF